MKLVKILNTLSISHFFAFSPRYVLFCALEFQIPSEVNKIRGRKFHFSFIVGIVSVHSHCICTSNNYKVKYISKSTTADCKADRSKDMLAKTG